MNLPPNMQMPPNAGNQNPFQRSAQNPFMRGQIGGQNPFMRQPDMQVPNPLAALLGGTLGSQPQGMPFRPGGQPPSMPVNQPSGMPFGQQPSMPQGQQPIGQQPGMPIGQQPGMPIGQQLPGQNMGLMALLQRLMMMQRGQGGGQQGGPQVSPALQQLYNMIF